MALRPPPAVFTELKADIVRETAAFRAAAAAAAKAEEAATALSLTQQAPAPGRTRNRGPGVVSDSASDSSGSGVPADPYPDQVRRLYLVQRGRSCY